MTEIDDTKSKETLRQEIFDIRLKMQFASKNAEEYRKLRGQLQEVKKQYAKVLVAERRVELETDKERGIKL